MATEDQNVVTRFAPSPTGLFHVGSVRSALYNYLFAKQHNGTFILRIEDTDQKRSKQEYTDNIIESLSWLGLTWDARYAQSERMDLYKEKLTYLIDNGYAYKSREEGDEGGEREVIRFKNPNTRVSFTDTIVGEVTVDTSDLGDFVIAKDMETPLYNFVVVVDDWDMNVTHVIRGQDHISNTPRQILILEALDAPRPVYAHIPLILAPDKTKLSKRHGALSTLEYKEQGYLPDALLNFMALIGWNPGGQRELFSKEELVSEFSLKRVQKGAGVFNIDKLNWINREYIKQLPEETFRSYIEEFIPAHIQELPQYSQKRLNAIAPIIKERIHAFSDVEEMAANGELAFYFSAPSYETSLLCWKKSTVAEAQKHLRAVRDRIVEHAEDQYTAAEIKDLVWPYADEHGRGDVLWPLRVALSGKKQSPDPFELAHIFGKKETIQRIDQALEQIERDHEQ